MQTENPKALRQLASLISSTSFRLVVSAAIFCFVGTAPALGQTDGFSSVYSDSWVVGNLAAEYDELQPPSPVIVSQSVGQMDPTVPDQSISVQTSLVSETGRTAVASGSGYSSASVTVTIPLLYDEAVETYEVGTYSTFTTYNSGYGQTVSFAAATIGVSISCYELFSFFPRSAPPGTVALCRVTRPAAHRGMSSRYCMTRPRARPRWSSLPSPTLKSGR